MGALALRDWARSAPRPAPPPATAAAAPSGERGRRPCSPPVPPRMDAPARGVAEGCGWEGWRFAPEALSNFRSPGAAALHPKPRSHGPRLAGRQHAQARLVAVVRVGDVADRLEAPEVLADRRVEHVAAESGVGLDHELEAATRPAHPGVAGPALERVVGPARGQGARDAEV